MALTPKAPVLPGVYAFIVDDVVVYLGLTQRRFDQYRRGQKGQRASSRINGRITETLRAGKKVKVLVATPEPSEWQELSVNTAAGLEVGLIEMIRPSSTACPYKERVGCDRSLPVPAGLTSCPCANAFPIYSTDALRVHERFHDTSTNGEAFGEVIQVWERVLLIHLLRLFERQGLLEKIAKIAFILDGPLATFGHPAWLSPIIKKELKRLNAVVRAQTGGDMLILGIEKTGSFVTHFEEIDQTKTGEPFFPPQSYALLTDQYIKERVIFSTSDKPYGQDTYFGRKFLYKARSGARIVATIPMLDAAQDDITTNDVTKYPSFSTVCAILDKLVSSRFPNSVGPIITAHSHAAIPLVLGTKVLEQLARALVKKD